MRSPDGRLIYDESNPYVFRSIAPYIREFTHNILHGDPEHCRWLLQAAESYIVSGNTPPARDNNGEIE